MITRRTLLLSLPAVAITFQAAHAGSKRTGMFSGRSRHTTTGGVLVDGNNISLAADFKLDNGPDPVVALGKDGKYDPSTFSGELSKLKGSQNYSLPPGKNAANYNEVYIWCRAADVPLGVASLK